MIDISSCKQPKSHIKTEVSATCRPIYESQWVILISGFSVYSHTIVVKTVVTIHSVIKLVFCQMHRFQRTPGLYMYRALSVWTLLVGWQEGHLACKKLSGRGQASLSVYDKVQLCMWPSWCHCCLLSLVSVKSWLDFSSFCYQPTQVKKAIERVSLLYLVFTCECSFQLCTEIVILHIFRRELKGSNSFHTNHRWAVYLFTHILLYRYELY